MTTTQLQSSASSRWASTLLRLGVTACFALAALAVVATTTASTTDDSRATQQVLDGEFVWTGYDSGPLEATFEPTGENQWKVAFRFRWNGEPKVYRGTAEGSLTDGPLRGTVQNETQRRSWNFEGTTTDGVFEGTHEEIKRSRAVRTGTLTLGRS